MDSAVEKAAASARRPETAAEVDARWRRYGVVEVMVRNPQVSEFVSDRELEIERLRAQLERMREALERCVKEMEGSIAFTHEYDDALAAARAALTKEEK